ncbi:putative 2-dehydropantoate 2-reductase [Merismopedia glauca]|uniref:2-dehydropantoate 2-reductase n=1 Tax=Merismopedia glauca CCAP 1448/3 TaxID=1296344 RepID=A0A2T1C986_9CYAN|nr:putative 2-dehydropantoate 2-reductase [Merismopedia glauca]PSB04707.1 putative 2-dehydropantoate 2-reductase [Merismopedia glauca CCAP 1448/3]
MSSYSYATIGTGAIGGFYGSRLQKAGFEVHFLLHSDYAHVKEHGLIVQSYQGDFTLAEVNAYQQAEKMPACDVAIIGLKTTHNHLLSQILPHVVKRQGLVLILQNGLGVEEEIAEIVGDRRILAGLCFICANKVAPGHIHHLDYGQIKIAEYANNYQACGITPQMEHLAADFTAANIKVDLAEDLLLSRWQKLVWNIPYNGLSVILDATTDELMGHSGTRHLVEELMQEVALGASACDRHIHPDLIQQMLDLTDQMQPYRTSMKLDYDSGRALEIETMFGNPIRTASSLGTQLPKISTLYQQLRFLNSRRNRLKSHKLSSV